MADAVRLGIVGYGQQGGLYGRLVDEGAVRRVVLGAVCDTDPARRDAAAAAHPGASVHEDHRALLASGDVDVLVTTLPHYLHPEVGAAALDAGVHVLVEKPVGVHTKQARELIDRAAATPGVAFGIMFNQRMNPLYQRLKAVVDGGEIGELRRTNWIITTWWRPQGYYDSSAWRATWGGEGGGVLVNQAPHQLDLWQWICGAPRSVHAKLGYGVGRDIAVENEVTALVEYENGATGTFTTSTNDLVGTDRLEILGTRGRIVVEGSARATITRLERPEAEISAAMAPEDVKRLFTGQVDRTQMYTEEVVEHRSGFGEQHAAVLADFASHVLDGTPLVAPGADGIHGVRLANAMHLSSWTGREVPLDFDEDEYLRLLDERIREEGTFPVRGG